MIPHLTENNSYEYISGFTDCLKLIWKKYYSTDHHNLKVENAKLFKEMEVLAETVERQKKHITKLQTDKQQKQIKAGTGKCLVLKTPTIEIQAYVTKDRRLLLDWPKEDGTRSATEIKL